jgi:hypothetical protein
VGFCVDHDLVERQEIIGREEEVEVLQCLSLYDLSVITFNLGSKNWNLQAKNSPCYPSFAEEEYSHLTNS